MYTTEYNVCAYIVYSMTYTVLYVYSVVYNIYYGKYIQCIYSVAYVEFSNENTLCRLIERQVE